PVSAWSGNRYRCRPGAHVNRAQRPVDAFVEAVVRERLSRPDVAGLLAEHDVDTAPLLAEIDRQKRLIRRAEADYKAELIEAADLKATRDEARTALRTAEDALATATRGSTPSSVLGSPDPVAAYSEADLTARRSVLDLLVTV